MTQTVWKILKSCSESKYATAIYFCIIHTSNVSQVSEKNRLVFIWVQMVKIHRHQMVTHYSSSRKSKRFPKVRWPSWSNFHVWEILPRRKWTIKYKFGINNLLWPGFLSNMETTCVYILQNYLPHINLTITEYQCSGWFRIRAKKRTSILLARHYT